MAVYGWTSHRRMSIRHCRTLRLQWLFGYAGVAGQRRGACAPGVAGVLVVWRIPLPAWTESRRCGHWRVPWVAGANGAMRRCEMNFFDRVLRPGAWG